MWHVDFIESQRHGCLVTWSPELERYPGVVPATGYQLSTSLWEIILEISWLQTYKDNNNRFVCLSLSPHVCV